MDGNNSQNIFNLLPFFFPFLVPPAQEVNGTEDQQRRPAEGPSMTSSSAPSNPALPQTLPQDLRQAHQVAVQTLQAMTPNLQLNPMDQYAPPPMIPNRQDHQVEDRAQERRPAQEQDRAPALPPALPPAHPVQLFPPGFFWNQNQLLGNQTAVPPLVPMAHFAPPPMPMIPDQTSSLDVQNSWLIEYLKIVMKELSTTVENHKKELLAMKNNDEQVQKIRDLREKLVHDSKNHAEEKAEMATRIKDLQGKIEEQEKAAIEKKKRSDEARELEKKAQKEERELLEKRIKDLEGELKEQKAENRKSMEVNVKNIIENEIENRMRQYEEKFGKAYEKIHRIEVFVERAKERKEEQERRKKENDCEPSGSGGRKRARK